MWYGNLGDINGACGARKQTARLVRNPYYTRLIKLPEENGQKYMWNDNLGYIKGACGARM